LFKKYDILYTREQFTGLFFKNFVLEIHSLPKKIKSIHKKIWGKARALIVLTSFIKNKLVEAGVPENKILIAPDGVDLEKFDIDISKEEARKKFSLPSDKILIGYVGMLKTMEMSKGIDLAIEALKNLPGNIILVLVGGNKMDIDEYQNFASSLDLRDRVIFTGRVRHELILYYLKAFDILIAPFPDIEHYRFYMSPLKLFEYMASGVPIVTSDLPSIREILNENNAVLVEPNNPEILSEGIKKVLENYDFSAKISKQAFQDVQNYTWKKRAERILEFVYP
jgi:glycosyltransferase involved in cell wall biosynthesis